MGLLDFIKTYKVAIGLVVVLVLVAIVVTIAVTQSEDFRTMVSARENKDIVYVMNVLSSRWRSTDGSTFMFETTVVPIDARVKLLYGNTNKKITRLEFLEKVRRYIAVNKLQNGNMVTLNDILRKLLDVRDKSITSVPVSQINALGSDVNFVVKQANNRVIKTKYQFVSAYMDVTNKILYADFTDGMGDGLNVRVVGNRIMISSLGCRDARRKCISLQGDRI